MGIIETLTPIQKAWITRRAKAEGKDPKMVFAGIRAAESRWLNKVIKKAKRAKSGCLSCG